MWWTAVIAEISTQRRVTFLLSFDTHGKTSPMTQEKQVTDLDKLFTYTGKGGIGLLGQNLCINQERTSSLKGNSSPRASGLEVQTASNWWPCSTGLNRQICGPRYKSKLYEKQWCCPLSAPKKTMQQPKLSCLTRSPPPREVKSTNLTQLIQPTQVRPTQSQTPWEERNAITQKLHKVLTTVNGVVEIIHLPCCNRV